jgi:hypothetical protein
MGAYEGPQTLDSRRKPLYAQRAQVSLVEVRERRYLLSM